MMSETATKMRLRVYRKTVDRAEAADRLRRAGELVKREGADHVILDPPFALRIAELLEAEDTETD